jgi:hypothetical protein
MRPDACFSITAVGGRLPWQHAAGRLLLGVRLPRRAVSEGREILVERFEPDLPAPAVNVIRVFDWPWHHDALLSGQLGAIQLLAALVHPDPVCQIRFVAGIRLPVCDGAGEEFKRVTLGGQIVIGMLGQ